MYFGESLDPILYLENYINFDINTNIGIKEDNQSFDLENTFLKPVFILLTFCDTTFDHIADKFVKGQKFWHATIGFDYALTQCYSFNYNPKTRETGLVYESIDAYKQKYPNADCQVSCVLLDDANYNKIKESLNYYIINKNNTKYDFLNLFFSFIGKATDNGLKLNQVCSTFVDSLLKSVNVNLVNKPTNLVKPDDLIKSKSNRKQFILFNGKVSKYKPEIIYNKIIKLSSNSKNCYFN